jgi:hypothetical protein
MSDNKKSDNTRGFWSRLGDMFLDNPIEFVMGFCFCLMMVRCSIH